MQQALSKYIRSLLLCLAMLGALPCAAQDQSLDSTYSQSTEVDDIVENSSTIDGEYVEPESEPERTIIYNSATPTDARWQQATSSDAFKYRDKREIIPKERPPEKEPAIVRFLLGLFNFFGSALGKGLLWIVFILIVGFIAYRIIAGQGNGLFGAKDRRGEVEQDNEVTEKSLLERDWEALISSATQSGDTRLAIRYSYLRLLQLLQDNGLLTYRPEKTNTDYYRELVDKPQRQAFRTMARQYEYAWYGNYLPEPAALDSYMTTFRQVKQSLGAP
jgi:hypothetical protein